ncbi:MAG: 50S ribosomal protein L15, partial [Raoultibacter sp.]
MELKDLVPAEGSTKARKRVGRGPASGTGKTAGRGYNGQKSRAGGAKGAGFEGGQTPLARRLPKLPGFRNINRVEYVPVNVSRLDAYFEAGDVIDGESLKAKGI